MIERSEVGKYAKHAFFARLNDVDIFVEDTAIESRKVYAEIFRRVLGGAIRIDQVFPIGSKSHVLKRCSDDQGSRARPAVYVVDGDFDILVGNSLPPIARLYRLKRYSVENYLIDEEALLQILDEEVVASDISDIRTKLDFNGWAAAMERYMADFVVSAALSHYGQCGLPTAKERLGNMCACVTGKVDPAKLVVLIAGYIAAFEAKFGAGQYAIHKGALPPMDLTIGVVRRYGCAKTHLLPLLKRRVNHKFGLTFAGSSFSVRIAKRCDVSELADIAGIIS